MKELLLKLLGSINQSSIKDISMYNIIQKLVDTQPVPKYKSYVAVISQSNTDAPIAIIINNDFTDVTFNWVYISEGYYKVVASTPVFIGDKTVIFFQNTCNIGLISWTITQGSTTEIYIENRNTEGQVNGDMLSIVPLNGAMIFSSFEIRVYN